MTDPQSPSEASAALGAAEEWARWAAEHDDWDKTRVLMGVLLREYDRMRAELERLRHVQCFGQIYSGLQPPERCGNWAGHEGKCQP